MKVRDFSLRLIARLIWLRPRSLSSFPFSLLTIGLSWCIYTCRTLAPRKARRRRVSIVATSLSQWRFEELSNRLHRMEIDVTQVVLPYGHKGSLEPIDLELRNFFSSKDISHISILKNRFSSVLRLLSSDVVLYSNPYLLRTWPYLLHHLRGPRLIYSPYTFNVDSKPPFTHFGRRTISKSTYFFESKFALEEFRNLSQMEPKHCVTGFPSLEIIRDGTIESEEVPSVIWAPHWTSISNSGEHQTAKLLSFIEWGNAVQEVVHNLESGWKYLFRPHPLLLANLSLCRNSLPADLERFIFEESVNATINGPEYMNAFKGKSVLIHNSASFIAEHCASGNGSIFWAEDSVIADRLNPLGSACIAVNYEAKNVMELRGLVEMLCAGVDPKKADRLSLIRDSHFGLSSSRFSWIASEYIRKALT